MIPDELGGRLLEGGLAGWVVGKLRRRVQERGIEARPRLTRNIGRRRLDGDARQLLQGILRIGQRQVAAHEKKRQDRELHEHLDGPFALDPGAGHRPRMVLGRLRGREPPLAILLDGDDLDDTRRLADG
ncbi:hypothetical protein D3C86_1490600 [compost metagenome]